MHVVCTFAACLLWYTLHRVTFSLVISEKNQRIDETVSQEQEGLKRRQRLDQNVIPDTDHDSNKKERVITSEDEGHVLSHDERLKEKYKFRGEIYLILTDE